MALIALGGVLLLGERHNHRHRHEALEHAHPHRHDPIDHVHPHVSDAHHRHVHRAEAWSDASLRNESPTQPGQGGR